MKIGFTCGVFDLFHAGHVLMLQECKEHCDYLIVALNTADNFSDEINPGKRKPVLSLEERKLIMANSRYVDEILQYSSEEQLLEILNTKKIDIRFLGEDYKGRSITGKELGIEIYYTNRDHGYSTTELIERIINKNR